MTDPSTILADIRSRLGCVPPAFAAASAVPAVLASIWTQTCIAYLDNPLPASLKEQLLGRLALLRDDRYMVAVHALRLHRLGVSAGSVLTLLTRPFPLTTPTQMPESLHADAEALVPLADLALVTVRRPDDQEIRGLMAEVLGREGLAHLSALLGWAGAQRGWSTGARDQLPEHDPDLGAALRPLLNEAPGALRLFRRALTRPSGDTPVGWYRAILDQSGDAMLVADADGHYLDVNPAATALLGYSRAEFTALTVGDVVARGPVWAAEEYDRFLLEKSWQGELELRRRDGSFVTVEARATTIDLPRGTIYVSMCRDISDRIRADAALRESEARFRTMADSAPVLIWMADPDKQITYVNQSWLEFTGRSLAQELGNGWSEVVHPDDVVATLSTYQSEFDSRRPFRMEYRLHRHDGAWRWVLNSALPMHAPSGEFNGYIGSCIDITERKQTEAEQAFLAETSRILSRSVDQQVTLQEVARLAVPFLADLCVALTIEGNHVHTAGIVHRDPDQEATLAGVMRRFPPSGALMRANRTLLANGQSWLVPDVGADQLRQMAASEAHFAELQVLGIRSLLITPLTGHSGPYGILLLALTSSGRRYGEAEARLATDLAGRAAIAVENAQLYREAVTARVAAEEAGRVRDEFLSVAAHELKTPTASIKGYAQLLQRRLAPQLTAADVQALAAINRSSDRLTRLVNDLLDISRLQREPHALRLALVNLYELARDAVAQIAALAPHHTLTISGATLAMVMADRDRLYQVAINLLTNAVKFSPDGGEITVGINIQGDDVVVAVTDQGVGIPAAAQSRVFEQFFRAHPEELGFEGMGVGLFLSHQYVALHGGIMWFTSEEGHGSTFYFSIPLSGGSTGG